MYRLSPIPSSFKNRLTAAFNVSRALCDLNDLPTSISANGNHSATPPLGFLSGNTTTSSSITYAGPLATAFPFFAYFLSTGNFLLCGDRWGARSQRDSNPNGLFTTGTRGKSAPGSKSIQNIDGVST